MNKICELIYDISPHSFFMLFSSVISLHQHGGSGDVSPDGGRGRSPRFTQSPPGRRARRAGRRSRRARRARASAGSASRAEPGEGENRCRRYALKRGFGDVYPDGGRGGAPANGTCPPDRAAGTETLQCATSSIRAILLRSLSAHPNCPTDQS